MEDFNFGGRIEELINKLPGGKTENAIALGKYLGITKQSVYDIYKKKDLSTEIVRGVCAYLGIDIPEFLKLNTTTGQTQKKYIEDQIADLDKRLRLLERNGETTIRDELKPPIPEPPVKVESLKRQEKKEKK